MSAWDQLIEHWTRPTTPIGSASQALAYVLFTAAGAVGGLAIARARDQEMKLNPRRVLLYALLVICTVVNIALFVVSFQRDTSGVFIDGVKQNCTVERTPEGNAWECTPVVST